jgi:hypothetical protein
MQLVSEFVALIHQLLELLRLKFKLLRQVVDVSFQSQDFLNEVFFFLLVLLLTEVVAS